MPHRNSASHAALPPSHHETANANANDGSAFASASAKRGARSGSPEALLTMHEVPAVSASAALASATPGMFPAATMPRRATRAPVDPATAARAVTSASGANTLGKAASIIGVEKPV